MALSASWFGSTAVASRPVILAAAASPALRLMSALASGLSDFLEVSSLAVPEVLSLSTPVRYVATASDSYKELNSLFERLDSPLEELHSLGEVFDSPENFLATAAWGLSRGVTATSDFDEELDSLVERLDSLMGVLDLLLEKLTSPGEVLNSLEVFSLGMPGVSSLATPEVFSPATLARCATTASDSDEELDL